MRARVAPEARTLRQRARARTNRTRASHLRLPLERKLVPLRFCNRYHAKAIRICILPGRKGRR